VRKKRADRATIRYAVVARPNRLTSGCHNGTLATASRVTMALGALKLCPLPHSLQRSKGPYRGPEDLLVQGVVLLRLGGEQYQVGHPLCLRQREVEGEPLQLERV
jgi:hypothetical protein